MVGALLASDGRVTQTTFVISGENVLVDGGYFTEGGLVENMAQTAAAGEGYNALLNGEAPKGGYIVALKNVSITCLPKAGDTILTTVTFLRSVLNYNILEGRVLLHGELVASCELTVLLNG